MSQYNSLKVTIDANIKQNGVQAITGQILNSVLNQMVSTLGTGYMYAGIATPATNPGSPDAKVFYIANGKGSYTNFDGLQITEDEVVILYWDSAWHKVSSGIASHQRLSEVDAKTIELDVHFDELKKNVEGEVSPSIDIDITSYAEGRNFIDTATYFVSAYYKGRFIPCEAEKIYTFEANSNNTSILAFLVDTDNISTGATPHFATGWMRSQSVLAGQSVSIKAPIDAKYIWVSSQNGTGRPNDFQSIIREPFIKPGLKDYAMLPSIAEQGFPQKDLPVISFVFDDLDKNDDDIVNLFNEYGIKCGFAFIASDAKMQENKERYLEYQRQGFSILNHSIDGKIFNVTNYPTIASAYTAIMTAKQKLESNGFIVNGFVAPSSAFENSYIDTLRNTHQYAYTTADLANTRSSNPCRISRESLQTTSLANILGGENVRTSIAFHIAVNRQLTFFGHSADFGISYGGEEFNLAKIRSVVERCISLRNEGKCLILSPNEMANYFFRGQININTNVSANRPISPQKGMMFFDSTLNKPIWYSGTSWVDANGTNV